MTRLARRGVVADVYVFGGAAMALAYDARRATRDIDAVFQPHGVVLDEARAVAGELGLPVWWRVTGDHVGRGSHDDASPAATRVSTIPGGVPAARPRRWQLADGRLALAISCFPAVQLVLLLVE